MSTDVRHAILTIAFLACALSPASAFAFGLPGLEELGTLLDLNKYVSPQMSKAMIKTVGLAWNHRPYEPASPLGTNVGLDLGVDVTLAKAPADIGAAVKELGGSGADIPVIPGARLHLHKGLGNRVNAGFSFIQLNQGGVQVRLIGADLQAVVFHPDEGPTVALRFGYAFNTASFGLDVGTIDLSTHTATPSIVVSRQMEFADPYIGIGAEYATGRLGIKSIEVMGLSVQNSVVNQAWGAIAFTGVQFRLPMIGLELTVEGSYSSADVHTLGTKFGFAF